MNKHTPGPWTYFPSSMTVGSSEKNEYGDHLLIATVSRIPKDVCEANGRLIAAAPDLLLACSGALVALRLGEHVDQQQVMAYLEEVLAKVEGK